MRTQTQGNRRAQATFQCVLARELKPAAHCSVKLSWACVSVSLYFVLLLRRVGKFCSAFIPASVCAVWTCACKLQDCDEAFRCRKLSSCRFRSCSLQVFLVCFSSVTLFFSCGSPGASHRVSLRDPLQGRGAFFPGTLCPQMRTHTQSNRRAQATVECVLAGELKPVIQ